MTHTPDYAHGIIHGLTVTMPGLKDALLPVLDIIEHLSRALVEARAETKVAIEDALRPETERANKAERELAALMARLADIEHNGYIPARLRGPHWLVVHAHSRSEDTAYSYEEDLRRDAISALLNEHLPAKSVTTQPADMADPRD